MKYSSYMNGLKISMAVGAVVMVKILRDPIRTAFKKGDVFQSMKLEDISEEPEMDDDYTEV